MVEVVRVTSTRQWNIAITVAIKGEIIIASYLRELMRIRLIDLRAVDDAFQECCQCRAYCTITVKASREILSNVTLPKFGTRIVARAQLPLAKPLLYSCTRALASSVC